MAECWPLPKNPLCQLFRVTVGSINMCSATIKITWCLDKTQNNNGTLMENAYVFFLNEWLERSDNAAYYCIIMLFACIIIQLFNRDFLVVLDLWNKLTRRGILVVHSVLRLLLKGLLKPGKTFLSNPLRNMTLTLWMKPRVALKTPYCPLQKSDGTEVKKARSDQSKDMPSGKIDSDQRDEICRLYKLEMPEDLYHFWDFCKELNPDSPCGKSLLPCWVDALFLLQPLGSIGKSLLVFIWGHQLFFVLYYSA